MGNKYNYLFQQLNFSNKTLENIRTKNGLDSFFAIAKNKATQ